MAINKVEYGGNTLIDITDTTASNSDVVNGKTFYAADGTRQTGSYTETDPVFSASAASGITSSDITSWNNKSTFSGDYDDLTNKPTIPTVNNGKLTIGRNGIKINDFTANSSTNVNVDISVPVEDVQINGTSILSSGNADIKTNSTYNASTNKIATMSDIPTVPEVGNSKIYYGTSDTEETTITKIVTCDNFVLETGATISVKFTNAHNNSTNPYLNVNNTGSKKVAYRGTRGLGYDWNEGQVVQFIYDGTNYIEVDRGLATTTYYGLTKLSNTINGNTDYAATPYAVKQAYDLADSKQDELVSGTNIKTINNQSLLGSGDITIGGGSDTGWIDMTASKGTWSYLRYRIVGKMVYVEGYATSLAWSGTSGDIIVSTANGIPSAYAPDFNGYFYSFIGGSRIARMGVGTSGQIFIDWTRNLSNGSDYTSATWCMFRQTYFVD